MIEKGNVTVVLPTLNEEQAIGIVVDEIGRAGYDNILVVDGFSADRTVEVAKERGATVVLQSGSGKGGAIRTAIARATTPCILIMDGDYSYDANDIEKLLSEADDFDLIIGARTDRRNMTKLHRLGNRIINWTFNALFGTGLTDVCSGMYLVRTEWAKRLDLKSEGFDVEVEIVAKARNERILEVPIGYRGRIGTRKLQTWKTGFKIIATIMRVFAFDSF